MKKGNAFCRIIYKLKSKTATLLHRVFSEPIIKGSFASCGKKVRIGRKSRFSGIENVSVGDYTSLGSFTNILTTCAKVKIGSHVMFGPSVTIVSGDHRTDVVGRYMSEIGDGEKRPEDDLDVVIENDVWVGTGAIILKGVTIGRGAVVVAGSVVTKSFPPYSIIGGVPAKIIKKRFSEEVVEQHEFLLEKKTRSKK